MFSILCPNTTSGNFYQNVILYTFCRPMWGVNTAHTVTNHTSDEPHIPLYFMQYPSCWHHYARETPRTSRTHSDMSRLVVVVFYYERTFWNIPRHMDTSLYPLEKIDLLPFYVIAHACILCSQSHNIRGRLHCHLNKPLVAVRDEIIHFMQNSLCG